MNTILTDKTLKSESQEDENENENENDKTSMSSNKDDDDYDEDDDDETMSENKKKTIIKGKNDFLDKIIDKSKSFEEQIKLLKKREDLKGFWPYNDLVIKS